MTARCGGTSRPRRSRRRSRARSGSSEAPSFGRPIKLYDPSSRGARAYAELADELLRVSSSGWGDPRPAVRRGSTRWMALTPPTRLSLARESGSGVPPPLPRGRGSRVRANLARQGAANEHTSSGGRRGGLGRGPRRLDPPGSGGAGLLEVDVDRIVPNPWQPRLEMDEDGLAELADSIREHGVFQPLIVTRADDDQYALVAGERRWRAARAAGLLTVPVVVKETTPRQRLELALVENIQRAGSQPAGDGPGLPSADRRARADPGGRRRAGRQEPGVGGERPAAAAAPPECPRCAGAGPDLRGARSGDARLHQRRDRACCCWSAIVKRRLSVRAGRGAGPPPERGRAADARRSARPQRSFRRTRRHRGSLPTGARDEGAVVQEPARGRLVIHFYSDDELTGLYEAICGPETPLSP